MITLTKQQFDELAGFESGPCVSFFLPTHRSGMEVLNRQDELVFKNLIKQTGEELGKRGYNVPQVAKFLEPLYAILEDRGVWRNQSNGFAVFAAGDYLRFFNLPFSFEPFSHLSYEFYLKPLLPYFMGGGDFYLLSLNLHEIHLYRGNRESIEEVLFDPPLPQRLEEVVGFDYEQKFIGYRATKMGGHSQAVFHGHAEWQADAKGEILSFFRILDKEIATVLKGSNTPLVIAALDHLIPIYREANTYPHLYPKPVTGNPKHVPLPDLHKKVWDMLAFYFNEERRQQADLLGQLRDTERTATDIREIIPAAMGGRVDALFLDKNEEIWGTYNKADASVSVQKQRSLSDTSLTNLAAVQVFLNGGKVYLEDKIALPLPYTPVNALYRY